MSVPFSSPDRQIFVQIAYHVSDLDTAVRRWHAMTGIGPFIIRRHIQLDQVRYRGELSSLDMSAAHAQAGAIQIELVQQHCDHASAFRDMFAAGAEGVHHLALFPNNHDSMVAHYHACGFATATELITAERRGGTYVDTRAMLGHMVEVYRSNDSLIQFYEQVAQAAVEWDGCNLIVEA